MQLAMATDLRISISQSNTKTRTSSISLPPGPEGTCRKDVPCWGPHLCYAWKMWNGWGPYVGVAQAWSRNLQVLEADRAGYGTQLDSYLKSLARRTEENRFFRFHVGGDCPNKEYVIDVIETAAANRDIAFTIYTKQYDWWLWAEGGLAIPRNLAVMFSAWPGLELPEQDIFPIFWMWDPQNEDSRIPAAVQKCPGSCPDCRWCWNPDTTDIYNLKH